MTVEMTDRIEMGDAEASALDEEFALLERMTTPEGFKAEIVEGAVVMSPQRRVHWRIIDSVLMQLRDCFGRDTIADVDVRLDMPGYRNGFAPDLLKLRDGAEAGETGTLRYGDVEFVLEVISRESRNNDYGTKLRTYATAGIPVYLIVDPYTGKCHAYGHPEGEGYESELTAKFGDELDLTPLGFDMRLETESFPRD